MEHIKFARPADQGKLIIPHPFAGPERLLVLTPEVLPYEKQCPEWCLIASEIGKGGSICRRVTTSLICHGDAVFAAFRYAICNAWIEADRTQHETPREIVGDLPGIARDFGPPEIIKGLRRSGWNIRETFRAAYHPDRLAGELRGYTLSGDRPGGRLAASVHHALTNLSAAEMNRMLWLGWFEERDR